MRALKHHAVAAILLGLGWPAAAQDRPASQAIFANHRVTVR